MDSLIANIRIIEDTLAFILLSIALLYLLVTVIKLKGIPIRIIPITLFWGLIPVYIWKTLGMIRRLFIEKADHPDLYKSLNEIREVSESFAGLAIALSFIFIFVQLRKLVTR
jgi:hypothetical protein